MTKAANYEKFDNYIEKVGNCQECIDKIGKGEYSSICMDDDNSN